ncbi:hypothetical protein [Ruegeria profundi]|uniref:Uncharacterized protein n=1 Tax=Ruegeria profundi TaxID=1685378 RepID=A0A0X3TQ58_9RHOB|nr:hypothetical protein [Ruegeria profundi]KUJ77171.1 hypothetical protein AVO44_18360 [Ruegeria profundi]
MSENAKTAFSSARLKLVSSVNAGPPFFKAMRLWRGIKVIPSGLAEVGSNWLQSIAQYTD